jgi:hypothetical protein
MILLRLIILPFVAALTLLLVILMWAAALVGWLASGDDYNVNVKFPRWQ